MSEPPAQSSFDPRRRTQNWRGQIKRLTVPGASPHRRAPSPAARAKSPLPRMASPLPRTASPLPRMASPNFRLHVPSLRPIGTGGGRSTSAGPLLAPLGMEAKKGGADASYCHWKFEDHKHKMLMDWLNRG
jgi:hypothetical protein